MLGAAGTAQYFEIAGSPGGHDWIASPGPGCTFPLSTDVWLTQARTSRVINGATLRHTGWPDVSKPDLYIRQETPLSGFVAGGTPRRSTAGQASVWYINKNPTPTDVGDKSGVNHSPRWAAASRPGLFTG